MEMRIWRKTRRSSVACWLMRDAAELDDDWLFIIMMMFTSQTNKSRQHEATRIANGTLWRNNKCYTLIALSYADTTHQTPCNKME